MTLDKWRPFWILHTMQCLSNLSQHHYVGHTLKKHIVDTKISKLLIFCQQLYQCFDLDQMAAIMVNGQFPVMLQIIKTPIILSMLEVSHI